MGTGTAAYWEYANSSLIRNDGTCNKCDAGTYRAEPPAGAPPAVDTLIVCEECERVVDAR